MDLNKAMIIGRLGSNPEMRYASNGSGIATANIATSRPYTDKSGMRQEQTEWHRVVFFDRGNYRMADIVSRYLHKGSQVYVEGRLQTNKWVDRNGNERFTTEIIANEMIMLGAPSGKPRQEHSGDDSRQAPPSRPARDSGAAAKHSSPGGSDRSSAPAEDEFDDDIPF